MSGADSTRPLRDTVAVVTGASRGIGKGIALELGAAGATVYVTGRTVAPGQARWPGTIGETADEIDQLGGRGVAVHCDHRDDTAVEALFHRVRAEQDGRLDVLVNNVYSTEGQGLVGVPFWELPLEHWDDKIDVGLRSHYVAAFYAAPSMVGAGRGLIVNVSSVGARVYLHSVAYGVGKAGVDKLTADMARELRDRGVAVVSIWPGLTTTELVVGSPAGMFDLTYAQSPRFSGRAVVALAMDPAIIERTGQACKVVELAQDYGFTDLDGRRTTGREAAD